MKIKETVDLPGIRSIVSGTHFGIPLARYMEGSVVRSSHLGPFAKKRAWRSYHRADNRIPTYEEGSAMEPDMELPEHLTNPVVRAIQQVREEIARGERASVVIDTDSFGEPTDLDGNSIKPRNGE